MARAQRTAGVTPIAAHSTGLRLAATACSVEAGRTCQVLAAHGSPVAPQACGWAEASSERCNSDSNHQPPTRAARRSRHGSARSARVDASPTNLHGHIGQYPDHLYSKRSKRWQVSWLTATGPMARNRGAPTSPRRWRRPAAPIARASALGRSSASEPPHRRRQSPHPTSP